MTMTENTRTDPWATTREQVDLPAEPIVIIPAVAADPAMVHEIEVLIDNLEELRP